MNDNCPGILGAVTACGNQEQCRGEENNLLLFCGAGDRTPGLQHARQVLHHIPIIIYGKSSSGILYSIQKNEVVLYMLTRMKRLPR
jgi:hypothetical protein